MATVTFGSVIVDGLMKKKRIRVSMDGYLMGFMEWNMLGGTWMHYDRNNQWEADDLLSVKIDGERKLGCTVDAAKSIVSDLLGLVRR